MIDVDRGEIISIHIGQAGIQTGNAVWELLCAEHCIQADGKVLAHNRGYRTGNAFFEQSSNGSEVPRSIFADLESTVIDEISTGSYKFLFHPDQLIYGTEDAANNFARGYYTQGKMCLNKILQRLRKLVEGSNCIQGFILYHSLGGGTGSGLSSLIFERIADEFRKKTVIEIPIYPSPNTSTSVVEPYNGVLCEHYSMDYCDISFILDNEALYEISHRGLLIHHPTYNQINRIVAQFCSALTTSMCFDGSLSTDIAQLQTNLIPFPRIHFPLCNYSPILTLNKADRQCLSVPELTRDVFDPCNQMVKLDPLVGRYMSCCILYRGDVSPQQVNNAILYIKSQRDFHFADWCPTAFKVAISSMPPTTVAGSLMTPTSRNVTLLNNTSAISQPFQRIMYKYRQLYNKRSFVHWFVGEGMEENEFNDSAQDIRALIDDYHECGKNTNECEDETLSESMSKLSKQRHSSPQKLTASCQNSQPNLSNACLGSASISTKQTTQHSYSNSNMKKVSTPAKFVQAGLTGPIKIPAMIEIMHD